MRIPLVMTIISPDRTGLVESIARIVAGHDGNWLESRMCRLGGEFAGILRMEVPAGNEPGLVAALRGLESPGVQIHVCRTAPVEAPAARQAGLEIVGADRPGIVLEITGALAAAGVNVEEFSSEIVSAPMSGENLFKAAARLRLPASCNPASLKKDLERIGADLLVDVSFSELLRA